MKRKRVIWATSVQNMMPISPSLLCWIILDKVDAVGWVRGASWSFIALLWISWVYSIFWQDRRDPFEEMDKIEARLALRRMCQ